MEQSSDHSAQAAGPSNIPLWKRGHKVGTHGWGIPSGTNACQTSNDASLFTSSLPVLPHAKLTFGDSGNGVCCNGDTSFAPEDLCNDMETKASSKDDFDLNSVELLLPDDDELFAGIIDGHGIDITGSPSPPNEAEEDDVFGSGGGLELDSDPIDSLSAGLANASISNGHVGNGVGHYGIPNGVGTVAGEHPYGEHPSRTLFVRNLTSSVEDSELRSLFGHYGDIRAIYTGSKQRGFVMISYYDIRDARKAMRALQNKPLRRKKLDIHFSIPKENPSEKDMNQGTLVVFNLDSSVSNDLLLRIFGACGEVKEIRETPHKHYHKFIEYYDVRAAEAALRSLNNCEIAGKRIKLQPSRPGGTRRSLMQNLSQDLEQDDMRNFRHQIGSPIASSPPGAWPQLVSLNDNHQFQTLSKSPTAGTIGLVGNNYLSGLTSVFPSMGSNSLKIAPIGKDQTRINHADQVYSTSNPSHGVAFQHPIPVPDSGREGTAHLNSSSGTVSSLGLSNSGGSSIGTLNGPQFLWGSPISPYTENSQSSAWSSPSAGHSLTSNGLVQGQRFCYPNHGSFLPLSNHDHHEHVGSAPSGVPFERHYDFFPESTETSFMSQLSRGSLGINGQNDGNSINIGVSAPMNPGAGSKRNVSENCSPTYWMMSSQRDGNSFFGNAPYPGSNMAERFIEHGRSRRANVSSSQLDINQQYHLDLEKIKSGEDTRTTLMIKNIPNKYTSKMLLSAINEKHKGAYDFLYLPIDFKNKCNVGYAFVNMLSPSHVIPFHQTFNGKKWEKFNSEKVATLAYARIQGKPALIAHFQNSSLMNEDKKCRPILLNCEGSEVSDQEPFPSDGIHIYSPKSLNSYSTIDDQSLEGHR
ncbi:LOW QUALITY PROTEIN: protein MEI2-like 2 [Dioscorea cayenensis subsp. rotundata]|uniref:LOW QUALITY PROTEIN: protein MEI2-like 2 n=1 Tax=Dioscorea cayennensis subsp. rotundata TaxID=55577 RepID=A0AB40BG32_DIOCR|nr:LOW QUALITY PROTEIN: protein MEI2-like 2 [Dioscorea cayenensis subsp. rotundata]